MRHKQRLNRGGNIMLVTAVLILIISIIVGTCMKISSMQISGSFLNRNTSNSYYLGKSGIEKQVDSINKVVESNLDATIKSISNTYIRQLTSIDEAAKVDLCMDKGTIGQTVYKNIGYKDGKIQIMKLLSGDTELKEQVKTKLYECICDTFVGKPITYEVKSDRLNDTYHTVVTVEVKETTPVTNDLLVEASVKTVNTAGKVYDSNKIQSIITIDVPDDLPNQIHESYKWAYNPSDLLSAPLICFSDLVVVGDTNKLTVKGDTLVKGYKQQTEQEDFHIKTETMDPDKSGGVIANQGGTIDIQGNLYTMSNVMTTDGWPLATSLTVNRDLESKINVKGDIVAHTVGIVDDFYEGSALENPFSDAGKVKNAVLSVGRNVFVENDIMIDRWAKNCAINIEGTALGVSNGSELFRRDGESVIDPNSSSSIYSQGENSIIRINNGIYVAGQPFITLETNTLPKRLYESVGEPFDGVSSWGTYRNYGEGEIRPEEADDYKYLLNDSPFQSMIKRNKVITNLNNTYAPAAISAKLSAGDAGQTVGCKGVFGADYKYTTPDRSNTVNSTLAENFLFRGGSTKTLKEIIPNIGASENYTEEEDGLVQDVALKEYFTGYKDLTTTLARKYSEAYKENPWIRFKDYGVVSKENQMGVLGYMNAMRGVFLGEDLRQVEFSDAIEGLPTEKKEWSYEDPIQVVEGEEEIDISHFYVKEGETIQAKPSIIVNPSTRPITLKTSETTKSTFNGIIISRGQVVIQGNLTLNGSVIIDAIGTANHEGAEEARVQRMTGKTSGLKIEGEVTLTYDKDMVFKVKSLNHSLYRDILDALNITAYDSGEQKLQKIYGPTLDASKKVRYTRGQVLLTDASYLEVDAKEIYVKIDNMKQLD